jgi:hypothetical protein
MTGKLEEHGEWQRKNISDVLKAWVMVLLTLLFVALYGAALIGWLRPLSDERMAARLEPIIFVVLGYYFGRLPSQQNEQSMKDEVNHQTHRADVAQQARENAQKSGEALEEKIKNVRTALTPAAPANMSRASVEKPNNSRSIADEHAVRHAVSTALNILNS